MLILEQNTHYKHKSYFQLKLFHTKRKIIVYNKYFHFFYELTVITALHSVYAHQTINNYKIISNNSVMYFLINVSLDLLMQMLTLKNQVVFIYGRC